MREKFFEIDDINVLILFNLSSAIIDVDSLLLVIKKIIDI